MHSLGWSALAACLLVASAYRDKDVAPYNAYPVDSKRYEGNQVVKVACPVCPSDDCQQHGGRFVKLCRYGTYINDGCNNRLDCFRGPGETCNEERSWICERSLSCRDNQCRGFSLFGFYEHPNYAGKDH